uniref:Delta(24(24(1)))-sterol reductase n=1 Tax=Chromera velia CCMP2878 TaxID=1169474 RepID=A0A0G4GM62_9ALVE|mmetsp:Transcript_14880/g.30056  ORF Transcript_14880/g.30056 Transcript_14880/m.30056 type:complete len:469 (+) Transcript_14880:238-1644(+)|eukprot:Cvel_22521.t1-p1 / transcript=Cvel_22521.t1 / gene=Cvel_22521 / organism=Chromera_velia_CCMP2878 / gene_product=Delta(24(24(1)))-sterol reductase, putative / transcript_product=Delta(24(24(1)))-sterol reductase, putative / location=Cvel_scaffold2221:16318-18447(-) / protein_length=468 / sequence_SO=supercontig / SO=protein_coding / is_pseudo=false
MPPRTKPEKGNTVSSSSSSPPPTADEIEKKIDSEVHYEFGGPVSVGILMGFFPCLMIYIFVCLAHNRGDLIVPGFTHSFEAYTSMLYSCVPTFEAVGVYGLFVVFEAVLAVTLPGPMVQGLPVPSLKGKRLDYCCNGVACWYATLGTAAVLHLSGVFPLTWLIRNFGPLMTVAIGFGLASTAATYLWTVFFGTPHRMSGNFVYDLFMGAPLNPRLLGGKLDLKMFSEIRVPWVLLFFITLSCCLERQEQTGHVGWQLWFLLLAHGLYTNACMKGEECIPTTWDIFYEKWGFMLIFWNFAGVPFTYCISSLYCLHNESADQTPLWVRIGLFALLLTAYYVWDTSNAQKNFFRMQQAGTYKARPFAFPQLPWALLKDPQFIKTKAGSTLLVSGWFGVARKINYTADLVMALCWGLACGVRSFLPFFYFFFFLAVLSHRVWRDQERLAKKYGTDWVEYCKKVPYIFVPYVV